MNTNKIIVVSVVTVLALLVVGGGIAFAQSSGPGWGMGGNGMVGAYGTQNGTPAPGYGNGMMGGSYGMMGNGTGTVSGQGMMGNGYDMNAMHQWMTATGGMHNLVWDGLAEVLRLTPDELNAELASGKTLTQIAEAQGVSQEELVAALEASVKVGLDKAVVDGALTQAQADQMLSHMSNNFGWMLNQMGTGGMGFGNCHGSTTPRDNS